MYNNTISKDISKYTLREEQQKCLDFIDKTHKNNKLVKFFLLDLPTGTGKSLLAMCIADWYRSNVNKIAKVDVITATKILQDQYSDTYGSVNNIKGKENYTCSQFNCSCAQGKEFARLAKKKCEVCPYDISRNNYINGDVSLTNFHLYSIYSLFSEQMKEQRDSRVLIVDEAHQFDDIISNFFTLKITENKIKKLNFPNEKEVLSELKKVRDVKSYIEFMKWLNNEMLLAIEQLNSVIQSDIRLKNPKQIKRNSTISKVLSKENKTAKPITILNEMVSQQSKIELILKEYKINESNWIFEKNQSFKDKIDEYTISAIWSYDFLDKYIFSRYERVFLMSGTILDKNIFCQLNGLEVSKSAYYKIPSPFDVENRKVFYMPIGKMSYKSKQETFQKYIPYIKKILKKYKDKKGIIHTNSFELASWIKKSIKDPRLVYHDSFNKDEILNEHKKTDRPTVIVSPSMDTGVSFDDDYARFQIIAKVPYPSLASQKNKMRQKNNQNWYSYKTCASLQQMAGRIVRSTEDHGDTIIIDGSFSDVIRYSSHYLLDWFQNSVVSVNVK